MLIGILQCGHAPDEVRAQHGDFDSMFANLFQSYDFTFQTWNVVDGDFPTTIDAADGWLISGSKHGAYEDHAFIPPLSDLIREIYASARPMVGICFGHQIIAQALGGHVKKFEGGWAIGRHDYSFNGHGSVTLNAWHQDQVTAPPPEAQVIGSSPFCQFAALLYGEKAFTVQPHPEFSNPVFDDYVKSRRSSPAYPAAVMQRADQLRHVPIQNSAIAADIAAFLKGEYRAEISS